MAVCSGVFWGKYEKPCRERPTDRSRGALKRWTPRPFDPDAEFVFRYHQRRANLEDYKLSSGGDDGHAVLRVQNK